MSKNKHTHTTTGWIHWNSFLVRKVVLIRSRWLSCLTKGSSHERFAVRRFFFLFSSRPRRPIILVYSEAKTCWLIEVQAESFSPSSNGARWISPDFLQEKHPTEKSEKSMNSVEWIINGNRKPFDRWKSTQKSYFGWNKRPETIFSNQLTRFIRTKAHRHTDSGPNNELWLNLEKFYEHFFSPFSSFIFHFHHSVENLMVVVEIHWRLATRHIPWPAVFVLKINRRMEGTSPNTHRGAQRRKKQNGKIKMLNAKLV